MNASECKAEDESKLHVDSGRSEWAIKKQHADQKITGIESNCSRDKDRLPSYSPA